MKFSRLILVLFIINLFWLIKNPILTFAKEDLSPPLMAYAGKSYSGGKDPEFLSYENELKKILINRINKKFGLNLNISQYSGFDLLEIESLLRCKKTNESPEIFLKMFPKGY